ncbi:granzyme K isoform X2 [Amia ocellicauda]|uniref:granzyme K isoform X2 n=1 Tax=Amia ocellicauda TaxID=2972642 RepID=UPI003464628D
MCSYGLVVVGFLCFLACCVPTGSAAKIIGGKEVKEHPWMVSLQAPMHVCGGTLIKENWVLTAAHCSMYLKQDPTVVLGVHSLSKDKKQKRAGIAQMFQHPEFNSHTKWNDIMLIKLKKKVKKQKKTIMPKDLPHSGKDIKSGEKCNVTGWGMTYEHDKKISDTLQGAEVEIIDRRICNKYYNGNPTISVNMLCAADKYGKKDTCKGDSGGPLICSNNFVGVVSGGNGKKPGVYTQLTDKYLSWIKNVIKKNANVTAD